MNSDLPANLDALPPERAAEVRRSTEELIDEKLVPLARRLTAERLDPVEQFLDAMGCAWKTLRGAEAGIRRL